MVNNQAFQCSGHWLIPSLRKIPYAVVQLRCHSYGTPQPTETVPHNKRSHRHRNEKLALPRLRAAPTHASKPTHVGEPSTAKINRQTKKWIFFKKTALLLGRLLMETQDVLLPYSTFNRSLVPSFWGFLIQSLYSFSQMGKVTDGLNENFVGSNIYSYTIFRRKPSWFRIFPHWKEQQIRQNLAVHIYLSVCSIIFKREEWKMWQNRFLN